MSAWLPLTHTERIYDVGIRPFTGVLCKDRVTDALNAFYMWHKLDHFCRSSYFYRSPKISARIPLLICRTPGFFLDCEDSELLCIPHPPTGTSVLRRPIPFRHGYDSLFKKNLKLIEQIDSLDGTKNRNRVLSFSARTCVVSHTSTLPLPLYMSWEPLCLCRSLAATNHPQRPDHSVRNNLRNNLRHDPNRIMNSYDSKYCSLSIGTSSSVLLSGGK